MSGKGKIFGIGLPKTGTTSLYAACDLLGYRAGTYRHMRRLGLEEWFHQDVRAEDLAPYEALTDLPIPVFYSQLDQAFPESRFVLTVRDVDAWLVSAEKHWRMLRRRDRRLRARLTGVVRYSRMARLATFGMIGFSADRFRDVYERHVREVTRYFRDRPGDLLVLDVCAGEGWEKLCPFLGRPAPAAPFPEVQPGYAPARPGV